MTTRQGDYNYGTQPEEGERMEEAPASIDFVCPHCGRFTRVAPRYGGLSGPCAGCGQPITIPTAATPFASAAPPRPLEDDPAMRMILPVGRSLWAIAAGYAGLFSVLAFPAPVAVLPAILAIRDIRRHPKLHGMGRAIFGLVMGILGTILLVIVLFSL